MTEEGRGRVLYLLFILFFFAYTGVAYSHTINEVEISRGPSMVEDGGKEDNGTSYLSSGEADLASFPDKAISEDSERENLLDIALEFYQSSQELWSSGKQEEALNALDTAYSILLKIDTDHDPSLAQQREDLRFMISKRILEIYTSRYRTVNGNHNPIPITVNEHVEYEIKQFQTVEREFFLRAYKRSGIYRPMIVNALKEAGLPEELSWLPLIESFFNVRALSPARALGLWQFIPSTGYKFGLKRDEWIDERLDPEKSLSAAIAYLQELHNIFGDWTTVLAAYNCGEGNVLRIIREQKINYLDNFWDLYEKLPRETARYVPRFLATLLIVNDPERYGFELGEPDKPFSFEKVTINRQVSLESIAKVLEIPEDLLYDLNPELRLRVLPPRPYLLKVPAGSSETLLARLEDIPEWSPPKITYTRHQRGSDQNYVYYKVKRGDTIASIAKRYKTSIEVISSANNIKKRSNPKIGQTLRVPLRETVVYASKTKGQEVKRYRVKKGDNLWRIAQRFDTDIVRLRRVNRLKSLHLEVGQVIVID